MPNRRIVVGSRGSVRFEAEKRDISIRISEGIGDVTEKLLLSLPDRQYIVEEDSAQSSTPRNDPDLDVSLSDSDYTFDSISEAHSNFGFKRLPHTIPHNESGRLKYVLAAASSFYFHLYQKPQRRDTVANISTKVVQVEFTELKVMATDKEQATEFRPSSGNMVMDGWMDGCQVYDGNMIKLKVDGEHDSKMYGIKIKNVSGSDLYPTLFYFDNSDFSIRKSSSLSSLHALMRNPSFAKP